MSFRLARPGSAVAAALIGLRVSGALGGSVGVVAVIGIGAIAEVARAADPLGPASAVPTRPDDAAAGVDASGVAESPAVLFQPGAWSLGPFSLTPRLSVAAGLNDNVTLAPPAARTGSQRAPVKSRFVVWTPELTVALPQGDDRYELNLRGESTRFASSSINDTDNVELGLDGLNLLDARTALAWRVSAQDWHDPVGTTDLSLQAASPDHFRAEALGTVLRHDSGDGLTRAEAEATVSQKRYLNHRDVTVVGDVDTRSLVARVLRSATGSGAVTTRWLAEGRLQSAQYPHFPAVLTSLDNTDARLLGGWQWEAAEGSARPFSGSVKAGLQHKDFSGPRPDYRGVTWDALLHWQPRARTLFDLASGRAAADAPGDDSNQAVVRQATFAWTELWRSDLRTSLTLVRGDTRYDYPAADALPTRRDHIASIDTALRFDLRRSVQVGLNAGWARRRSNQPVFDYARHLNSVMLQAAW